MKFTQVRFFDSTQSSKIKFTILLCHRRRKKKEFCARSMCVCEKTANIKETLVSKQTNGSWKKWMIPFNFIRAKMFCGLICSHVLSSIFPTCAPSLEWVASDKEKHIEQQWKYDFKHIFSFIIYCSCTIKLYDGVNSTSSIGNTCAYRWHFAISFDFTKAPRLKLKWININRRVKNTYSCSH